MLSIKLYFIKISGAWKFLRALDTNVCDSSYIIKTGLQSYGKANILSNQFGRVKQETIRNLSHKRIVAFLHHNIHPVYGTLSIFHSCSSVFHQL